MRVLSLKNKREFALLKEADEYLILLRVRACVCACVF